MSTSVVIFYGVGLAAVAWLIVLSRRGRRGPGGAVHDRYEVAFLNGGPARAVDSALASLHGDGRIAVGGPGIVQVLRPTAHDPVERAVLQELAAAPHGALATLRFAVMRHPAVQETGDALAARGLIAVPAARRRVVRWCVGLGIAAVAMVPVALVVTIGQFAAGDTPVPFILKVLPVIAGVLITAVVCGASASGRVSSAGHAAVSAYRRRHAHLADPGTLVALHGLRALPDPVLREQLATAARFRAAPPFPRGHRRAGSSSSSDDSAFLPVMWCAAAAGGDSGGGGGCGSGGSCSGGSGDSGGSSCSGGGGSCSSGGGSSCSSSSSSSCSSGSSSCSSSSSSCGSSS
ncbi:MULTISPECIES: TIGR04222 domain-containing membrane protein [unclassified Streptomyces]|uniref:TIGR04222 domain-containing membrane protein n=1 Tax=unclassified Streptomyces TaxID=2593676 RepID=UPI002E2EE3B2|nr:TIGR04222 domain-containing membrane protein [Streptomyces sp. NBC_01268]